MTELIGMTWNHQRGLAPLLAATEHTKTEQPGFVIRWDARSLREFEDVPVAELAARYDLIAVDHPFVGQAAESGSFVPLDDVLPAEMLAEQRTAGARLPANPTHLWSSFLTLCHQYAWQIDHDLVLPRQDGRPARWPDGRILAEVAVPAIEQLYRLLDLVDPVSMSQDPIQTLDDIAAGAPVRYVPLIFGYSNYARSGYAAKLVRFTDAPGPDGTPAGAMIGGVGLAISSRCRDVPAAARFAAQVVSSSFQCGEYLQAGGQPGHCSAWTDPAANELTHDFFRATLDHAFVRGRNIGYPTYQQRGGELLHALVGRREEAGNIASRLAELSVQLGWADEMEQP